MPRRLRRLLIAAVACVVLGIGAGFAVFVLRGSDAPPPPSLSEAATATPGAAAAPAGRATWEVVPGDPTFVGYRVREEFASFGVRDAVGRTGDVTGTARVNGDTIEGAQLETDMTTLRSDESRRDNALRGRAIETARFPTATFGSPARSSSRASPCRPAAASRCTARRSRSPPA